MSTQSPVLEVVLFRLKPGVDHATLLRVSDEAQVWLVQQPGYLGRELSVDEDGQWIDMVHWSSMADVQRAAALFMQQTCAIEFGDLMDETSMRMLHLNQMRDYVARPV